MIILFNFFLIICFLFQRQFSRYYVIAVITLYDGYFNSFINVLYPLSDGMEKQRTYVNQFFYKN